MRISAPSILASFLPLGLLFGCTGEVPTGEAERTCEQAVDILTSCGVTLAEHQFGTCQPDQEELAAQVIDVHAENGCAWLTTAKGDGWACAALPILCVDHSVAELEPFTTDACSLFVDGSPSDRTKWQSCCIEHDFAYYAGGPEEAREAADDALRSCFAAKSNGTLAELVRLGVRLGGTPALPTPWRWGYGWKYDPFHGYRTLTPEQAAAAATEIARFRANPVLPPTLEERMESLADSMDSVPGLSVLVHQVNAHAAQLD